jgi:hypothetical protein
MNSTHNLIYGIFPDKEANIITEKQKMERLNTMKKMYVRMEQPDSMGAGSERKMEFDDVSAEGLNRIPSIRSLLPQDHLVTPLTPVTPFSEVSISSVLVSSVPPSLRQEKDSFWDEDEDLVEWSQTLPE